MIKIKDLTETFRQSILKRIGDFNIDMSEILLDSILDSETLKEIPIIKYIHAIGKISLNIKNQFLIKKMYRLLFEIESTSEEERARFIEQLDSDHTKKNILDNFIILIDRIDNEEKMSIIGKLLKSMILEVLDIDIGFRLISVVDKSYIDDLEILNYRFNNYKNVDLWMYKYNYMVKESLSNIGLLSPVYVDNSDQQKKAGSSKTEYRINEYNLTDLGNNLVKYGF
jgi:hypothetical protein